MHLEVEVLSEYRVVGRCMEMEVLRYVQLFMTVRECHFHLSIMNFYTEPSIVLLYDCWSRNVSVALELDLHQT